MDTIGKEFVDFWGWAAEKGLMNENTAKSLAAAVRQVISIEEDWETKDVTNIDIEDLLNRFKNKRGKDFKPESLNVYGRRFKQALDLFLQYTRDPANWNFKGQTSPTRKPKVAKVDGLRSPQVAQDVAETLPRDAGILPSLIEYPFPLRDNCIIRLKLPPDLKVADVERLAAFMRTLALDFAPSQS